MSKSVHDGRKTKDESQHRARPSLSERRAATVATGFSMRQSPDQERSRQALQPASRRAARSVTSGKFATMKFRDAKDLALADEREKQTPKLERQTEALSRANLLA